MKFIRTYAKKSQSYLILEYGLLYFLPYGSQVY